MKPTIEQEIIAARDKKHANEPFVRDTMQAIKKREAQGTFEEVIRKMNTPKKENIMSKLRRLPRYAGFTLAVAGIIATGGIGYAAYNWFGTEVRTTGDNTVRVTSKDCPPSLLQQYRQTYQPTMSTTYKILRSDIIEKQDFKDAQLVECEQRAIMSIAQSAFPDNFTSGDSHNGMFYPEKSYGTIESIEANAVTIRDVPQDSHSARANTTVTIRPDTQVISGGKTIDLGELKQGDKVFFAFQNSTANHNNETRQHPNTDSHVLVLAKTQYDYQAKDKLYKAAAQEAFIIEASTDEFGG